MSISDRRDASAYNVQVIRTDSRCDIRPLIPPDARIESRTSLQARWSFCSWGKCVPTERRTHRKTSRQTGYRIDTSSISCESSAARGDRRDNLLSVASAQQPLNQAVFRLPFHVGAAIDGVGNTTYDSRLVVSLKKEAHGTSLAPSYFSCGISLFLRDG